MCHTGQHYDHRYSGAMIEEFGLEVHVHLGIDGTMTDKTAQIVQKFGRVLTELKELGLTPLPYIHGDTMTSMAVGVASYLSQVACVHVEAGIRTITPRPRCWPAFLGPTRRAASTGTPTRKAHVDPSTFERGSREPFPEQFNTRVSDAATGYHAAPVELVRGFLLDEGFPPDTIEVVGNTVVDATEAARARRRAGDGLPDLPAARERPVHPDLHPPPREHRGRARGSPILFDALERLVRGGEDVLFIRLFGTDAAIDRFGLRARLDALVDEFPVSFISSEVWPNYRDVIAATEKCGVLATDSGSMQEEANVLGVPCVTLRFGSDRGETLLAGGNVLAPPVDADFVAMVIRGALADPELGQVDSLYGTEVAARVVDGVLARAKLGLGLFRPEEARLGLA